MLFVTINVRLNEINMFKPNDLISIFMNIDETMRKLRKNYLRIKGVTYNITHT